MTERSGAQILSTVPHFEAMVGDRHGGEVTAARWRDAYEAHDPEVFATYYSSWGDPARRQAAADRALALSRHVREREGRAAALVEAVSAHLLDAGLVDEPLRAVLLVGVGSSNGWAAIHQSVPTLFLALERALPIPRTTGSSWPTRRCTRGTPAWPGRARLPPTSGGRAS